MISTEAIFLIVLILFCVATFDVTATTPKIVGVAQVLDGDTIKIKGKTIRLFGIDAPEKKQKGGIEAHQFLKQELNSKIISCELVKKDLYGRSVGICRYVKYSFLPFYKKEINRVLVEQGHAWAYRAYSKEYILDENIAKKLKRGVWQQKNPTPPWQYRKQKKGV